MKIIPRKPPMLRPNVRAWAETVLSPATLHNAEGDWRAIKLIDAAYSQRNAAVMAACPRLGKPSN